MHLLRGGIIDIDTIEFHLAGEFERVCAPLPVPQPGYFEGLASWAVQSSIAHRERRRADLAEFIRKRREEAT